MAVKMKNTILIQCSRCGITERHKKSENFVDNGWVVRNGKPFCSHCKPSEYDEFQSYFEYLQHCESERIAELRKEFKL